MFKYIILEGVNGCGKTTIGRELEKALNNSNNPAKFLHFPDETDDLGKVIRKTITDKDLAREWTVTGLLYAAESEEFHIKHSKDEYIYVLDRHSFTSSLIYQKGMSKMVRDSIYHHSLEEIKKNAIVFYLDVSPEVAYQRFSSRNLTEKLPENKDKDVFLQDFEKYAEAYTNLLSVLNSEYQLSTQNISVNQKTPAEIVTEILAKLG